MHYTVRIILGYESLLILSEIIAHAASCHCPWLRHSLPCLLNDISPGLVPDIVVKNLPYGCGGHWSSSQRVRLRRPLPIPFKASYLFTVLVSYPRYRYIPDSSVSS